MIVPLNQLTSSKPSGDKKLKSKFVKISPYLYFTCLSTGYKHLFRQLHQYYTKSTEQEKRMYPQLKKLSYCYISRNKNCFILFPTLLDSESQAEQFVVFPAEHESCENHGFLLLKIILPFSKIIVINVTEENLKQGDIFYFTVQNTKWD